MPEGYEDVTTMRGVAKRRKELDIAAPSTNHIPPASESSKIHEASQPISNPILPSLLHLP
jgi:hypothetical protein